MKSLEANRIACRKYYHSHVEEEAKRKAIWYQANKETIEARRKERKQSKHKKELDFITFMIAFNSFLKSYKVPIPVLIPRTPPEPVDTITVEVSNEHGKFVRRMPKYDGPNRYYAKNRAKLLRKYHENKHKKGIIDTYVFPDRSKLSRWDNIRLDICEKGIGTHTLSMEEQDMFWDELNRRVIAKYPELGHEYHKANDKYLNVFGDNYIPSTDYSEE